jgi:hypothetical protein
MDISREIDNIIWHGFEWRNKDYDYLFDTVAHELAPCQQFIHNVLGVNP